jgi:hypothetical protein
MGTWVGGPFPGVKARPVRDADHSPHVVPRSLMSRSYTSSPPCASIGVLWDCFYNDADHASEDLVGCLIWVGGRIRFCCLWMKSERKGGLLINSISSVPSEAASYKHRQPKCIATSSHVFLAWCCKLVLWWRGKTWICLAKLANK